MQLHNYDLIPVSTHKYRHWSHNVLKLHRNVELVPCNYKLAPVSIWNYTLSPL